MKKTAEQKIVLKVQGKITRVNIIDGGTSVEVYSISDSNQEYIEKYFPIVKASELSLKDKFLQHKPESKAQQELKEMIVSAIKSGLSDFRLQRIDPSYDYKTGIFYEANMKPATGHSAIWWKEKAEQFMPERGSRLETTKERVAWLGLFIRYLIEEKDYKVSEAWKAICDQSENLGNYDNKSKALLETTGNRKVGDWYDLANTYKIVSDDEEITGFSTVGGCFLDKGDKYPLADKEGVIDINANQRFSVGCIVISV